MTGQDVQEALAAMVAAGLSVKYRSFMLWLTNLSSERNVSFLNVLAPPHHPEVGRHRQEGQLQVPQRPEDLLPRLQEQQQVVLRRPQLRQREVLQAQVLQQGRRRLQDHHALHQYERFKNASEQLTSQY